MSTILILNDFTGRSRVAMRMLTAALESRGHDVLALPTALISNTLDLGKHAALDTTDYLLDALAAWEALGVRWDCAMIGYVTGVAQARALCDVAEKSRTRGAWVLVDPILGEGGRMYNSVTPEQAEGFRLLVEHADLITPNDTEARLLANLPDSASDALALDRLAENGGSVLVTSARLEGGESAVLGYDARMGERFAIPFERVPGRHFGTGDLFSAMLVDGLLRGLPLESAAREAAGFVGREIRGEGMGILPPPVHALDHK